MRNLESSMDLKAHHNFALGRHILHFETKTSFE